jgi:nitrous oxide reductase accessory protein NosL
MPYGMGWAGWKRREGRERLRVIMKTQKRYFCFFLLLLTIALTAVSHSGDRKPIKPGPKDKCPVCGMFVAKYPDWVAEVLFRDGTHAFFDGTKDMFKYYFSLKRHNPSKTLNDIDSIYVIEYYGLTFIDGTQAYYVIGSDTYGPMGRELIPFKERESAKEFLKDHKGKAILKFNEVTPDTIKELGD